MIRPCFVLAVILAWASSLWAQSADSPINLRCEYRDNPLVIGTTAPRLSWQLGSPRRGVMQSAYRILAASTPQILADNQGDLWDTGQVAGDESLQIEYAGKALVAGQRVFWKVATWDADKQTHSVETWSAPASFSVGPLQPGDWKAAWIGFPNDDANRTPQPAPCFRKEFTLAKPIARATIHICGLGQYELTLNGKKVGESVLSPAWTVYAKTCIYDSYDVTTQLKSGPNAVGIMLGNGMYNVLRVPNRYTKYPLPNEPQNGSLGVPKVIAQLEVEFTDGTKTLVGTDATWHTSRGPVVFTHVYGGEDYDARRAMTGWDSPLWDDASWGAAVAVPAPGANTQLVAAPNPPIKIAGAYTAVKVTQPLPGTWVYDFGQNLSGWPHLKVQGPAGTVVRMTPGELLAPDGTVSQTSSGGPMWFAYTLNGDGVEDWRPRFTYYGYRYIQVQGAGPKTQAASGMATVEELASEFVHAAVRPVGTFVSSDAMLNRVHKLINMAMLSNMQSVLTDCPHREKFGWLEVSHLMAEGIAMNYDLAGLYTKMCRDMRNSQLPTGLVPCTAPEYTIFGEGFRDSPEWGSAAVIDPWFLYQTYGDTRILREQYDTMKQYVAYLASKASGDILAHGLGDWFDIGPRAPGVAQLTSIGLTATATYYQDLEILRNTAALLQRDADVQKYAADAVRVRGAFNRKFFDPATGQYEKGSQTANAMPLALGLADPAINASLVRKLADSVKQNQYRVTAGDVGFSYLVKALTDNAQGDIMFNMMLQSTGPGYVMQLNKDATTLTEAWDALASSSQNHLMLGHAEAWLYRGLAGIQNDPAGGAFKKFFLRPQIVGTLTSASAEYESPRGLIKSSWKRDGKQLAFTVTIPPNTIATVFVPAATTEAITESGRPAQSATGVKFEKAQNGAGVFTVQSGSYVFGSTLP